MNFLTNLKKAAKDAGVTVAKKTNEIIKVSKTKYNIYDAKNDIEKIYTDMGREIYLGYKEDKNVAEFIEEKCQEIDALIAKMESLKEEIGE
ncbi:MAG: hypothetical protein IJW15_03065 [Clostridia bacterium]|nr:hypothetical protein [Clostridia bacterium]